MSCYGTWVRINEASKFYGVSKTTIRKWANTNRIECKRTVGNQRVFNISQNPIIKEDGKRQQDNREDYIYVRVSSKKQKDDLERQKNFMLSKFPNSKIITDIGSGLNYKRKGLRKLLDLSFKNKISRVIIFSKDRLCRFGFEMFEWLFERNQTSILVFKSTYKTPEEEFTEDILAILQVFSCRWNGKRKYKIEVEDEKYRKNKVSIEYKEDEQDYKNKKD